MQTNKYRGAQPGTARRAEGYTLVEVLFAILIAAITASVLFTAFDNGFAVLRTTREDLRGTQILLEKTEAIRMMTWQDLGTLQTTFTNYYDPTNNSSTIYTVTVNPADALPFTNDWSSGLRLVTITVNWTTYLGQTAVPHSRQMQTLSAQYGMQGFLQ